MGNEKILFHCSKSLKTVHNYMIYRNLTMEQSMVQSWNKMYFFDFCSKNSQISVLRFVPYFVPILFQYFSLKK